MSGLARGMIEPPTGFDCRGLRREDVDEVVAMVNACELHDSGRVMLERADLLSDMRTDGFDPDRDAVVVVDGERIVAWGIILHRRSRWADVHPEARGRGIGTWLMRWSESRGGDIGSPRIGQTIEDTRRDVAAMFAADGYTPRRTSWVLRMDHSERQPEPEIPPGVSLRPFRPDDEEEALTMFEQAFSEFEDRLPSSLTTWRAMTIDREGFTPDDLILAVVDGRIVGGAFLIDSDEVWVDKLAVDREHRHRGIARALLQTAFRRSFDLGYARTSLSTDSNTGALALYERVGMKVVESYTHYALDL
jgi:mycothiol synthase